MMSLNMTAMQKSVTKYFMSITLFLFFSNAVFAVENQYSVGHGALDVFNKDGFLSTPVWVQAWLVILISTFIASTYFAWKHALARWATGGFILSMTMGHTVFGLLGLPFLGGSIAIMHLVCWSPTLFFLLLKRPFFNNNEQVSFRIWSGSMTGVLIFSFVFDIRDTAIYISHVSAFIN